MLRNFLTVASRHILRNKTYSLINVAGLTVGMVGFILILDYVRLERSYDNFHDHADEIYRVQLDQYKDNQLIFKSSENYPAAGPALVRELPGVVDFDHAIMAGRICLADIRRLACVRTVRDVRSFYRRVDRQFADDSHNDPSGDNVVV